MKKLLLSAVLALSAFSVNASEIGYSEELPTLSAYTSKDYQYISSTNDVDVYMSPEQIYKVQTEDKRDNIRTAPVRFDVKTGTAEFPEGSVFVEYQSFNCRTKENLSILVLLFGDGEFVGGQPSDNVWEKTVEGTNGRLINDLACSVKLSN